VKTVTWQLNCHPFTAISAFMCYKVLSVFCVVFLLWQIHTHRYMCVVAVWAS